MRLNIMVMVLLSSAASAQAGSIDAITTGENTARSIEKISCDGCVVRAKKKEQPVVELAPGTQKIEIREVDGVKKIYRTEAWLGGSPVVYVSKALPDDAVTVAEEQKVKTDDVAAAPDIVIDRPAVPAEADMIDEKATTSAVTADTGAEIKVDVAPKAIAFDPGKLELRIN
jgi:hypothetical protein